MLALKSVRWHRASVRFSSFSTQKVQGLPTDYVFRSPGFFPEYPCVLPRKETTLAASSASISLMNALREGGERIVDVEVGRYDDPNPGAFEHVSMPLRYYLDWLGDPSASTRQIDGKQVYLAQWRARDEIDAVKSLTKPPGPLESLLAGEHADLYQTGLFLGPTGAITPLHYDSYMNLFHLQASSHPLHSAKHFTLLPPFASEFLQRADQHGAMRRTSPVNLTLIPKPSDTGVHFDVEIDESVPARTKECISKEAISWLLREGETLFIPRGWWHRVENVFLKDVSPPPASTGQWTAGVSWWFLLRNRNTNYKSL